MSFGMFGSIFLLAQFFQTAQGYSPLQSGLRILPWTAMPMIVAPIAGALSDRIGGHKLMGTGLALQALGLAWIAAATSAGVSYVDLVVPFTLSGIGMGLFFAPVANVVLSSVRPAEEGQASGANSAIRELGGVFGVAVLASVFTHYGSYDSPADVQRRHGAGRLDRRSRRRSPARSPPSRSGAAAARRRSSAGRRARARRLGSPGGSPRRPFGHVRPAPVPGGHVRPGHLAGSDPPPVGGGAVPPPSRPRLPARTARVCMPFGGSCGSVAGRPLVRGAEGRHPAPA